MSDDMVVLMKDGKWREDLTVKELIHALEGSWDRLMQLGHERREFKAEIARLRNPGDEAIVRLLRDLTNAAPNRAWEGVIRDWLKGL